MKTIIMILWILVFLGIGVNANLLSFHEFLSIILSMIVGYLIGMVEYHQ